MTEHTSACPAAMRHGVLIPGTEGGRGWALEFHLTPTWSMSDEDKIHSYDKGGAGTPSGLEKQLQATGDKEGRTGQ